MNFQLPFSLMLIGLMVFSNASAAPELTKGTQKEKVMTIRFAGIDYLHRWSKNGQNEFTPANESDLSAWEDMVTINISRKFTDGDQLADLANRIYSNYEKNGVIVRTTSKPRTAESPAEHLVVAALGDESLVEAAFARVFLVEGVAFTAVYSHRIYGKDAGDKMEAWLNANGSQAEKTLMAWDKVPSAAALEGLPQNK